MLVFFALPFMSV